MTTRPRPIRSMVALVLALLLVSSGVPDADALSWGTTRALSTNRNAVAENGLAVSTGNVWHALYGEARGGIMAVRYRRSTDAGVTWSSSTVLSSAAAQYADGASIVGRGSTLDAVWVEYLDDFAVWKVMYRRSTDAGVTWKAPMLLSAIAAAATERAPTGAGPVVIEDDATRDVAASDAIARRDSRPPPVHAVPHRSVSATAEYPSFPRIARDSSDRVVAVWTDQASGAIHVRRSADGGATWSAAKTLATTSNEPFGPGYGLDAQADVGAGTGIFYIAYYATGSSLRVRRSTDGGANWGSSTTIASNGDGFQASVAATGSSAVVGYGIWASEHQYAAIRRTSDKGASWKAVVKLGSSTGYATFTPKVIRGGTWWRAIYERCLDSGCKTTAVYYRGSADGVTWTTATRISTSTRPFTAVGGLAYADRLGALMSDWAPAVFDSDVAFRAGS